MPIGPIPITFAAAAALLVACGASDKEIREAQSSGYRADFALVYSETLAAVRDLYPELAEDARGGVIRTAWHVVHVQQGADDSGNQQSPNPGAARGGLTTTTQLRQQYFIRFEIRVVGGDPWRVRVQGEASLWKAGEVPSPLRGAEVPHWVEGRVNALEVAIHERLRGYAVAVADRPEAAAPPAAPSARPVDLARYGRLPAGAAQVVAAVDRAAAARDVARLRTFMVDDFTYATGDAPSADTAIVMWQADPSILAELTRTLAAGCAASGDQVVCPAAPAGGAAPTGYRAVFRPAGATWKLVSFASGD